MGMNFFFSRRLVLAACTIVIGANLSSVLAVPVSSSREFVEYLNAEQKWDSNYKFKFNWLGECYRNHNSAGRVKAFVCTNGVVWRTSPRGVVSSCRVSKVKVNKKNKIKLTTANCQDK